MKKICSSCQNPKPLSDFVWHKPYELKVKRVFFFCHDFQIVFDGTTIHRIIGGIQYYNEMKDLTAKLNAAYNLGFYDHLGSTLP